MFEYPMPEVLILFYLHINLKPYGKFCQSYQTNTELYCTEFSTQDGVKLNTQQKRDLKYRTNKIIITNNFTTA